MPCSGPRGLPARDFGIGATGIFERAVGSHGDVRVNRGVQALDALEVGLRQFDRGELAGRRYAKQPRR